MWIVYVVLVTILLCFALDNKSEYFYGYFKDLKTILSSPLRWDLKNWIYLTIVVILTIVIYSIDPYIQAFAQDNVNNITIIISRDAKLFGSNNFIFVLLASMFICGIIFKDKLIRKTALLGLESLLITALFIQILKFSFHRHRPNTGDSYNIFDGPGLSGENLYLSFPSGHASVAFSVLSIIAKEYSHIPIIPPVAYSIATLTAFSRVHDNVHWASDVFFGGVIAYFIAKSIVDSRKNSQF